MSFTNPYPASRLSVDTANSLANGLVGFWPLTDGGSSTTAKDITSNANDGTQSGGVSWASTDIGTAASFDGVDDRFDLTSIGSMDFSSSDFTVSMWIYVDSISSPEYLWAKQTSGNSPSCTFWFYNSTTLQLIHLASTTNCATDYTIASSLVGGWNHLVASVSSPSSLLASNHAVYLNGELLTPNASVNGSGTITASSGTLSLAGRISDNLRQLSGDIQNVRVYNRALSATEVATLFNRPWESTNYGTLWPYSPPAPADATLSSDTAATSLMSGCQAWWLLTDGSGTTATDIVGSNDGAESGTVGWDVTSLGNAPDFDGTDDRFEVDDAGDFDFGTGDFSVSAWVYYDTIAAGFTQVFTRGDTSLGTACWFGIYKNSSTNKFIFDVDDNILKASATSSVSATSGTWFHVVGVRNSGGTNVIYINGVSTGTASDSGNSISQTGATNQELRIGCQRVAGTYQEFHDGNIQNVRIWNRALSADEITLLYERPFEGIEYGDAFHYDPPTPANLTPLDNSSGIMTDCVGWWPLTETDDYASGAADISGNANNGTQSGGVLSEVSRLGGVASFDGFDDIIDASAYTIASTSSMTMAGWIRYTSTVGSVSVLNICNAGGSTTAQYTRNIAVTSSGNAACNVQSGTVIAQAVGSTVFDIGEWYFVVGTFDKVGTSYDVEIFVNGVSEATASGTGSELTPHTNTCIGGARRYNNAITAVEPCEIHNARIWDRILTSDEIWSIYQNPWLGSAYTATPSAVLYNYILRSKRFRRLG